jgi:hypothetical protein
LSRNELRCELVCPTSVVFKSECARCQVVLFTDWKRFALILRFYQRQNLTVLLYSLLIINNSFISNFIFLSFILHYKLSKVYQNAQYLTYFPKFQQPFKQLSQRY